VPGWCRGEPTFFLNGEPIAVRIERGYAKIRREWKAGDAVEFDLPMPVERVESHPGVKFNAGRTALQRGPIVYCLEGADNKGRVRHLSLPRGAELVPEHRPDLLGGVTVLRGEALAAEEGWEGAL